MCVLHVSSISEPNKCCFYLGKLNLFKKNLQKQESISFTLTYLEIFKFKTSIAFNLRQRPSFVLENVQKEVWALQI